MSRVLLTGMSGTGKSTVLRALSSPDTICVDLDESEWMISDHGARQIAVSGLVDWMKQQKAKNIVLAGCESNQKALYPFLDSVIVLTAPLHVMRERILRRENPYGKSDAQWRTIQQDTLDIEPLLKSNCTHICNTDRPFYVVLSEIKGFLT